VFHNTQSHFSHCFQSVVQPLPVCCTMCHQGASTTRSCHHLPSWDASLALPAASTAAPAPSSWATTAACPLQAAWDRGVAPSCSSSRPATLRGACGKSNSDSSSSSSSSSEGVLQVCSSLGQNGVLPQNAGLPGPPPSPESTA
jgi:hypothetical protein